MTVSLAQARILDKVNERFILREKDFCKKAYKEEKVDAGEVDRMLQAIQLPLSSMSSCGVPDDVLSYHIFSHFGKKELNVCLAVCKQFQMIAIPLLIQKAGCGSDIYKDLNGVEAKIDNQLLRVKQSSSRIERSFYCLFCDRVRGWDLWDLQRASKIIDSFKAYCIFLVNHPPTHKNFNLSDVKNVLRSVLQVEKACQSYIKARSSWF